MALERQVKHPQKVASAVGCYIWSVRRGYTDDRIPGKPSGGQRQSKLPAGIPKSCPATYVVGGGIPSLGSVTNKCGCLAVSRLKGMFSSSWFLKKYARDFENANRVLGIFPSYHYLSNGAAGLLNPDRSASESVGFCRYPTD